jgi:hypothetical protein
MEPKSLAAHPMQATIHQAAQISVFIFILAADIIQQSVYL